MDSHEPASRKFFSDAVITDFVRALFVFLGIIVPLYFNIFFSSMERSENAEERKINAVRSEAVVATTKKAEEAAVDAKEALATNESVLRDIAIKQKESYAKLQEVITEVKK